MKLSTYLPAVLLGGLAAISFTAPAFAQDSGAYGAIGTTSYDPDIWALDAKLGYNFSKTFGVEVQGAVGLTSESDRVSTSATAATLTTDVDYTIGAFAVARLPVSEKFDIFARAGLHKTKVSYELNNAANSQYNDTDTGFAVGGGFQYNFDSKNGIRAEYTYFDKTNADTMSIGYVRKF